MWWVVKNNLLKCYPKLFLEELMKARIKLGLLAEPPDYEVECYII
jgi:hypothetical protein